MRTNTTRASHSRSLRVVGVACAAAACLALLARPAHAQTAPTWGDARLPGGVPAAWKVLGWDDSARTPAAFLIDLARYRYGIGASSLPVAVQDLSDYLEHLARLESLLRSAPQGFALSPTLAKDRARREQLRDILELLALRLTSNRNRFQVQVNASRDVQRRQAWADAIGIDVRAVADRLNKGETVTLNVPSDALPLPLPAFWKSLGATGDVTSALVTDSRSLLFYLGLTALDPETLEWLGAHPQVLKRLYEDRTAAWAAFSRAFRIRRGIVEPPGGPAHRHVWEDLVDVPVDNPERYVDRLFDRDEGRLAYFADTLESIGDRHRQFVMGQRFAGAESRQEQIRFVRFAYETFRNSLSTWNLAERPVYRPDFDAGVALAGVDILPDGTVGPDWWPRLLERVADDAAWPSNPNDTMRALRPWRAEADWFLFWVFEKPLEARARFTWLRFLQRNFSQATRDEAPSVEIAVRALREMPALALALERMGVQDPRLFESVARAARAWTNSGDQARVVPALREWQGTVAVLEQLTKHGALDHAATMRLLASLVAAAPWPPSDPIGITATWLLYELVPSLGLAPGGSGLTEEAVLTAIFAQGKKPAARFRWEGINYQLDLATPALASALKIRRVTPGPHLEHLLALKRADSALLAGVKSLDELAAVIKELEPLPALLKGAVDGEDRRLDLPNDLAGAVRNLGRIRNVKDLPRASRQRPVVLAALDYVASVVMPGLAYALAMSPTSHPPRIYADGAMSHDLGRGVGPDGLRKDFKVIAWTEPRVVAQAKGGAAIIGSLLGIDIARAGDRLLQVGMAPPPSGRAVPEPEVAVLVERVAIRVSSADWEAEGKSIAAAVARGRALVDEWARVNAAPVKVATDLRAAGVSAWRSNLVAWAVQRGGRDTAGQMLAPSDLYRMGATQPLPAAWGQVARAFDGCWCLAAPARESAESYLGRASGALAAGSHDLTVQLSVLLAEQGLPQALLEPIMTMAIQDGLDRVAPFGFADWETFTWPKNLTGDRLYEYLQGLVAQGLIATVSGHSPQVGVRR